MKLLHIISVILFSLITLSACENKNSAGNIIKATGTIEATEVEVRSKVAGTIEQRLFDEGTEVKKGDLLCSLDIEEQQINLETQKQRANAQEKKYDLLRNGYRKAEIESQAAIVSEYKNSFDGAEREYKRIKELYEKGVASKRDFDKAETDMNVWDKRIKEAQAQLSILKDGYRKEDINSALASTNAERSSLELIEKYIRDAKITAPIDGTVTEKLAEKGEFIREGSPVALISDLQDIWLTIYIPETDYGRIKLAQEASVEIDSFPGKRFPGKIIYISKDAEFTPKNVQTQADRVKLVYEVKVRLDNKDGLFKPGMIADAYIETK